MKGNGKFVALSVALLSMMTVAVVYSPTLYRMYCAFTGYGGTIKRGVEKELTASVSQPEVKVRFDANVAPGLDWEFRPEKREITTRFDEPTQVYYYAKNNTDHTIVAQATFNITPYPAAPYFFKIQCFCFTKEKLGPGESARMPLVLYVDSQMLKDKSARDNDTITLSYTFFKQDNLTPEEVAAARDLAKGSQETEARLETSDTAVFDNDSPRD